MRFFTRLNASVCVVPPRSTERSTERSNDELAAMPTTNCAEYRSYRLDAELVVRVRLAVDGTIRRPTEPTCVSAEVKLTDADETVWSLRTCRPDDEH